MAFTLDFLSLSDYSVDLLCRNTFATGIDTLNASTKGKLSQVQIIIDGTFYIIIPDIGNRYKR